LAHNAKEVPKRWLFTRGVEISPSGRFVVVIHGAPPKTLEVYDIRDSRVIADRAMCFGGTGYSIAWSPDEKLLVVNGDNTCSVLEMPTLKLRHEFPMECPCFARFSPSSQFLALGSWTKSFIIPTEHLEAFVAEQTKCA
jgi:WD40 repeat protein